MKKILLIITTLLSVNMFSQSDYYYKGSGSFTTLSNWGINPLGTGAHPADFTDGDVDSTPDNYHITNNTTASLDANWTLGGIALVEDGMNFTVGGAFAIDSNLTFGGSLDFGGTGTGTITISTSISNGSNLVSNLNPGTVIHNTSKAVSPGLVYYNLIIATSASLSSNIDVTNQLTINAGITLGTFSKKLTVSGDINCIGTINGNASGLLTLSGTASSSIKFGAIKILKSLIISPASSSVFTLGTDLTCNNAGVCNINNCTLDITGVALTVNSKAITFGGTGFIKGSATSTLNIGGPTVTSTSGNLIMDPANNTLNSLIINRSGSLPLSGTIIITNDLSINGGCTFGSGGTIDIGNSNSGARISAITGSFAGTFKTNLIVPASGSAQWRTFNSPVTGKTIADIQTAGLPMTCLGCTNGPTSAGGTYFISVQGNPSGDNATFTELIPTSSISNPSWIYCGTTASSFAGLTLPVTGSINQGSQAMGKFSANPYPSPISASLMQAGGAGAITVWNGSGFTAMSGGIGTTEIAIGQSFYATTAFTLLESHKTTGAVNIKKTSTSSYPASVGTVFELDIKSAYNELDKTYIRFHGSATAAYDDLLDAHKIYVTPGYYGTAPVYNHYTTICSVNPASGGDLAINSLPYNTTSDAVIPIRAKVSYPGTFTISPVDIANLPATACVTLKDNLLNITHDLRTGSYICTISDTTNAPRFELTICASAVATGINNTSVINSGNTLINQDVNGAYVKTNFATNTKATISAFNVMGQKLMADKEIEGTELTTYLNLGDVHSQVIIIRVTTAKENTTKKIFIN